MHSQHLQHCLCLSVHWDPNMASMLKNYNLAQTSLVYVSKTQSAKAGTAQQLTQLCLQYLGVLM